jgi:hypothetical protein
VTFADVDTSGATSVLIIILLVLAILCAIVFLVRR